MKVLKQVLGIDVAQKELVVTLGKMYDDFKIENEEVISNLFNEIFEKDDLIKKLEEENLKLKSLIDLPNLEKQFYE